jgi:hypothetical protein
MPDNHEKPSQVQNFVELVDDSRFTEYYHKLNKSNTELGQIRQGLNVFRSMILHWKYQIEENRGNKEKLSKKIQALVAYFIWVIDTKPKLIERYETWMENEGLEGELDKWQVFKREELSIHDN